MERRRISGREGRYEVSCAEIGFLFFWFLFFTPSPVSAEEAPKKLELSAAYRYGIPVGEEEAGLNWSDLYEKGSGEAFEVAYRTSPRLALYGGVTYDVYRGKEVSLPPGVDLRTGRFNDQKLLAFYVGVKGYLLRVELPQKSAGINPYLRADVGLTLFNEADFNGTRVADRSQQFAFSVGAGADILTYTRFILFFETKYEDHGTPDRAAGAFRSVPISLGLRCLI